MDSDDLLSGGQRPPELDADYAATAARNAYTSAMMAAFGRRNKRKAESDSAASAAAAHPAPTHPRDDWWFLTPGSDDIQTRFCPPEMTLDEALRQEKQQQQQQQGEAAVVSPAAAGGGSGAVAASAAAPELGALARARIVAKGFSVLDLCQGQGFRIAPTGWSLAAAWVVAPFIFTPLVVANADDPQAPERQLEQAQQRQREDQEEEVDADEQLATATASSASSASTTKSKKRRTRK